MAFGECRSGYTFVWMGRDSGSGFNADDSAQAGDQMVAQGAGVRSARGALGSSDGRAKQPRYGIRFKRTGKASGAHVAHCVHLGSCMMAGQACNHTTHIVISFLGWCTSRRRRHALGDYIMHHKKFSKSLNSYAAACGD
ncbi:hypothetical protein B0H17DRAFT_1155240 [Mycena rosella]|uniref:Uncharacterized protein n=1 Tax=Mycena rosella TaxID=1033263 RepID=A0AAD7AWG5_MYCRO|nr:hypothetical protein B0H17DRAFT_1155240 [Mycena rosella]